MDKLDRVSPLDTSQKEVMLTAMIRKEDMFRSVITKIEPSHFGEYDKYLTLIWATVLDHHEKFDALPSMRELDAEIASRLSKDPDYLSDSALAEMNKFIGEAYADDADAINSKVAVSYVQRLMGEKMGAKLRDDFDGDNIADLPSYLEEHAKAAQAIQSMQAGPVSKPFPDNPEEMAPLVVETTGVAFLDSYMNGGMALSEVCGFCGPYGSCKTTLAVLLAVNRADWEYKRWISNNKEGKLPVVYYVTWEESLIDLRLRFISCAAKIVRTSLEGVDYYKNLSTAKRFKNYEKRLFKEVIAKNNPPYGEKGRMKVSMRRLNHNLRILDFSGAEPLYREAAGNMAQGLASVIENDQQLQKNPGVSTVICDYAGAAAEAAIQYQGLAHDKALRHLVGKFPMNLKNMVAQPFNCHTWVFHQLGTEAQSKGSGSVPKNTDAAEARNFFENVNFGFMVGNPTQDNRVVLTNGKQRRAKRSHNIILKINGAFCRVDVDTKYHVGANGEGIVSSEHSSRVQAAAPVQAATHESLFDETGI
jgi:hypothetical protein